MIARERNARRRIRYGQAILLGCTITREDDQAYAKPKWYARLPIKIGGLDAVTGPWEYKHEAVDAALDKWECPMSTAKDFEVISICITKRAADQLRSVGIRTHRTPESLAESAVEDACIMSEREYPPTKEDYRDGNTQDPGEGQG